MKGLKDSYNDWWQARISNSNEKEIYFRETRKLLRDIYRFLGKLDKGKLLDVCCATGGFLSYLEEFSDHELYGIDISSVAIDEAKQRLKRSELTVGDAQSMPYEDNFFNYVICYGSLEHLIEPMEGVKEISRVMKPSGKALILVPNLYFLGHIYFAVKSGVYPSEGQQQFSEMFSTLKGWDDLISAGGLKVESVYKYNYIFATQKVGWLAKSTWNLLGPIMPMGLSWAFIFVCSKASVNKEN